MRSDAELVGAVLAGDREAFADLVRRYERAARAVAVDVVGDHHAAQDAAQEAFIAAYEKLGSLRDGAVFGSWMLKIVRNHALNWVRRRSRQPALELLRDPPACGQDGRLEQASQRLLAAVTRLPEHERVVVMLRYFDGHGVRAIAEMTGRPVGTVTTQLSRARDRLRGQLTGCEL